MIPLFITLTHTRSKGRIDVRVDLIRDMQVREVGTLVKFMDDRGIYVDESPDEIHAKIKHQVINQEVIEDGNELSN